MILSVRTVLFLGNFFQRDSSTSLADSLSENSGAHSMNDGDEGGFCRYFHLPCFIYTLLGVYLPFQSKMV